MLDPNNIVAFKMSETEIAKYCPTKGSGNSSTLQVYVPTLMPKIAFAIPKQVPTALNSACYLNDKACKPSISKQCNSQNFKSVPRYINQEFKYNVMRHGAVIYLDVKNSNPDTMHVTNHIDPSTLK